MKNFNYPSGRISFIKILFLVVLSSSFIFTSAGSPTFVPGSVPPVLPILSEQIFDVPIDAVFYNECCDEDVYITGTAHLVINDNIIHLVVSDLSGTGLSTNYTYEGRGPSVETNVFYSNQNEGIFTFKLHMTNEDGCSFRLKATFRIELNANGETVVNFQNVETKCQP